MGGLIIVILASCYQYTILVKLEIVAHRSRDVMPCLLLSILFLWITCLMTTDKVNLFLHFTFLPFMLNVDF